MNQGSMYRLAGSTAGLTLVIAAVLTVTGCGKPDPSTVRPVSSTVGSVVDAGVLPLPNRPGYQLRHYEVLREMQQRHYIYVIEKDEQPVAGINAQYTQGKSQVSVETIVEPLAALQGCKTVADCEAKLADIKQQADYRRYLELKARFETEPKTKKANP